VGIRGGHLSESTPRVGPGSVIGNGLRLTEQLGSGGWSTVYSGTLQGGTPAAVKVLARDKRGDPEAEARFLQEARVLSELDHLGFCRCIASGRDLKTGAAYIVMEQLHGEDLASLSTTEGPLPVADVVDWFEQAAGALAHAHGRGFVHRDLKPSNLFLHHGRRLVVLDLGVVRVNDADEAQLTGPGHILGTPLYMAPEQASGQHTDHLADVWAMGMVAVQLLTGTPYWGIRPVAQILADVVRAPLAPPSLRWPGLPRAFDRWFFRACARAPDRRFPSMLDAARALRSALDTDGAGVTTLDDMTNPPLEAHNPLLPVPPNPLVGREDERRALTELLLDPSVRLVTLLGVGGTGKTRLAIALAHELASMGFDGVYFVDLSRIGDPGAVAETFAQVLGVGEGDNRSDAHRVADFLAVRTCLLVVDNLEHVVDAGAAFLDQLCRRADGLTVLATSRVALDLSAEHRFPLMPLALPIAGADLKTQMRCTAMRLLLDRIEAVRPSFRAAEGDLPALMELAHRVEGLPLALELVASRVRLMPPSDVLLQYGDRLNSLGGPRDLPERQRTMNAVFDGSYAQLPADAQVGFRRLACIPGAFDLELAETVVGPGIDVLTSLAVLVDHSLLRPVGGGARWSMLMPLREFGRARLDKLGERGSAEARLVAAAVCIAEEAGRGLRSDGAVHWLARLDRQRAVLRAAIEMAITHGDGLSACRLCGTLVRYWYLRGLYQSGRHCLRRALALHTGEDAARAWALFGAGRLAMLQCDYADAKSQLEAATTLFERLDLAEGVALTTQGLGSIARELADYPTAMRLHQACLDVAHVLPRWA
jgi:predicted ATPase/serine/threonine protein kinase